MTKPLRIGTRGSPLARIQAGLVADELARREPGLDCEVVVIRTTGDHILDRPLAEVGGKGLFTKEIEQALLDGGIDLAVHSLKDMATILPEGTEIGAVLPREDPRDALIADGVTRLEDLPRGAVVGTASLRRRAQVLDLRPDLGLVNLRGSVETRLGKLRAGEVQATLLAFAGLRRLGRTEVASAVLDPAHFVPAVAQGAIAIQIRTGDDAARARIAPLDDAPTRIAVSCERAFLRRLDGSCRTPIAAHATLDGDDLHLKGLVARPDGSQCLRVERHGSMADALALGTEAGAVLAAEVTPDFFSL